MTSTLTEGRYSPTSVMLPSYNNNKTIPVKNNRKFLEIQDKIKEIDRSIFDTKDYFERRFYKLANYTNNPAAERLLESIDRYPDVCQMLIKEKKEQAKKTGDIQLLLEAQKTITGMKEHNLNNLEKGYKKLRPQQNSLLCFDTSIFQPFFDIFKALGFNRLF